MAFDLNRLQTLIARHGHVARIVIADVQGSSPREVGAHIWVWQDGQSGTIGGGALEYQAVEQVRAALSRPASWSAVHPLGPQLGQCCGGVVRLVYEIFDQHSCSVSRNGVVIRAIDVPTGQGALALSRIDQAARGWGQRPMPTWIDGHMIEPEHHPKAPLWIWGAGHVGRALLHVMAPLPQYDITWLDVAADRFPPHVPQDVNILYQDRVDQYLPYAPKDAQHLIVTYSHALDLALCDAILRHGFSFAGLIGSKTKWARFRSRLASMGHSPDQIRRITCPIGRPEIGKHPFEIAISVSSCLLERQVTQTHMNERIA